MESNDELLVSDDNSSDDTMGILKEYSDTRIIVFKNNFNSVNKNFEFLISKAKADFIFLSDQDDLWMNNKIKICKINLVFNTLVLSDAKVIFNKKLL
jgi:glycosyltransferase involved in cell wall biosynthesis